MARPKPFKQGLDDVMQVFPMEHLEMQGQSRPVDQGLKKFLDQGRIKPFHPDLAGLPAVVEMGPPRNIQGHQDQGFIHGQEAVAVAVHPLQISPALAESLPQT